MSLLLAMAVSYVPVCSRRGWDVAQGRRRVTYGQFSAIPEDVTARTSAEVVQHSLTRAGRLGCWCGPNNDNNPRDAHAKVSRGSSPQENKMTDTAQTESVEAEAAETAQVPVATVSRPPSIRRTGVASVGIAAVGALAFGAVAVGAVAIGSLAIGRLALGRAKLHRGQVDELRIARLIIGELRVERPHKG